MAEKELDNGINATPSLMEQFGKAFLELEALNDAAEDKILWKEIQEHFHHLETVMVNKFLELEVREKAFKEEESAAHMLLAERETAVAAKEQDMLDQIQELKDAAVAAIAEARATHLPASLEPMDVGESRDGQVSSNVGDANAHLSTPEEKSPYSTGENAEGVAGEVKPRPELMQFCEQMDAKGLLNFILENKKNRPANREEFSVALQSATEPGLLVLASMEGFYPPNETTQERNTNNAVLQGMRQSCLLFLEAMATMLARADPSADHLLNPEIKQQAKAIADEWKPKLANAGTDAANGISLEAEAFLQLLVSFRIASEFDEEELCKLVLAVSHNRQAPELCLSLGLTHKVPGIVDVLISSGKEIDAARFIHTFQLTETFPLVPLLKTYLKDVRRNSQGKGGHGVTAGGPENDVNAQELAALRAVIRCVQDYKLQADYPLEPLKRRVAQLDRSKPDKKRFGELGKHQQFKKPRANGGPYGFRAPVAAPASRPIPPVFGDRGTYTGMPESYPHAGPNAYDYQAPSQPTYTQQAYDQRSYYYPQDDRVTASTYNASATNYGSYMGSGVQSSHQPYM